MRVMKVNPHLWWFGEGVDTGDGDDDDADDADDDDDDDETAFHNDNTFPPQNFIVNYCIIFVIKTEFEQTNIFCVCGIRQCQR